MVGFLRQIRLLTQPFLQLSQANLVGTIKAGRRFLEVAGRSNSDRQLAGRVNGGNPGLGVFHAGNLGGGKV